MDLVTQAVLGGAVGYAAAGKQLDRRSIYWGMIGGIVPDLDMLLVWSLGPFAEFQFHRGFTHGLVFDLVLGWLMGVLLAHYHRSLGVPKIVWQRLMILAIATHPFLDIFTSYGTQLFWPLTNLRVGSFAVSVVDPFYTVPLMLVLLYALNKPHARAAYVLNTCALVATTGYLLWGGYTAQQARDYAIQDLGQRLPTSGWQLQPQKTFGQIFLHRVVAQTPDKVFVGYLSTLKPRPIHWQAYPVKTERCWQSLRQHDKVKLFEWFSGLILPELQDDQRTYHVYDLRYGFLGEANKGIWGITLRFDPKSCAVIEPVERFAVGRGNLPNIIKQMYQMAFGGTENGG